MAHAKIVPRRERCVVVATESEKEHEWKTGDEGCQRYSWELVCLLELFGQLLIRSCDPDHREWREPTPKREVVDGRSLPIAPRSNDVCKMVMLPRRCDSVTDDRTVRRDTNGGDPDPDSVGNDISEPIHRSDAHSVPWTSTD